MVREWYIDYKLRGLSSDMKEKRKREYFMLFE